MGRTKKSKKSYSQTLLNWVTFVFAVSSILSLISSWISPVDFWPAGILGLAFPYFFLINLILLITYTFKKKLFLVVPLIAFIIGMNKLPLTIQLDGDDGAPAYVEDDSDVIKLLSFNVRVFDLYNWTRNIDTREKIFNYIEQQDPDVLCIQEFYSSEKDGFNNFDILKSRLNFKYYHVVYPVTIRKNEHWGIVIYSKLPIISKGVLYFDEKKGNVCIYTDILQKNDTIRFYNTHLQSIRFNNEDYKFIESLGADQQEQEKVDRTKAILGRLRLAYTKRAHQAEQLSDHVSRSPFPVVICGDFNDTPISYCYRTISSGLKDAFRESGSGMGSTYSGPIPGLRIDYVLHSKEIDSHNFQVNKVDLSDHYPITCKLSIPE